MLTEYDIEQMEREFRKELKREEWSRVGAWGIRLIGEMRLLRKEVREAQIKGIRLAASVASDYDKANTHPYLVSDCILCKLNVRKGGPRKNPGVRKVNDMITDIGQKLDSIEGRMKFLIAAGLARKDNAPRIYSTHRPDLPKTSSQPIEQFVSNLGKPARKHFKTLGKRRK